MNSSGKVRPPQGKQHPPQGKSLKNKLRSLQRLLNREKNPGLPRPAVHGKVRLLRKLEAAAKVHDIESREKRYSELYHHVKFFERRKAERRLKKAQKKLEDLRGGEGIDDDDKSGDKDKKTLLEECEEEVKECEQNVLYVKWFPKHIKYVSLYPSRSASKDEQLDIRRAALRRWTLINAEAKMFVPTPPEQDGNVDFGEEEEEEEEEEDKEEEDGGKKKKKDDDKDDDEDEDEKEEVPVKASIKHQPTSSSSSLLSKSKSTSKPAVNGVGIEGRKRKRADAVEAVKLPSRPVAPSSFSSGASSRRGGLEGNSHELVDFEDDAAVAAEAGGASGISQDDAFFSSVPIEEDRNAVHAPPVFVELAPEDDPSFGDAYGNNAEDGNWRSAPTFNGQRSSAARFERERLGADSKRYRDSAASAAGVKRPSTFSKSAPGNRDGGGGGEGGEEEGKSALLASEDKSKLDGLLGRKRKRAERALKFEQSRGGGGAAVLGVGGLNKAAASSYDEAFFGTSRDQGAKLKHQERIKAADRKLLSSSTAAAARTGRVSFNNNNNNHNNSSNNRGRGGEVSVMPVIHHAIPKRLVSSIASAGKSTRMTFD